MSQAETCPVCKGKGKILDESTKETTCPQEKPCHGCSGKGWVEVGSEPLTFSWCGPGTTDIQSGRIYCPDGWHCIQAEGEHWTGKEGTGIHKKPE